MKIKAEIIFGEFGNEIVKLSNNIISKDVHGRLHIIDRKNLIERLKEEFQARIEKEETDLQAIIEEPQAEIDAITAILPIVEKKPLFSKVLDFFK